MARCNTSGTKGFQQLDSGKLGFLVSVLQRQFFFYQIAARFNTKCTRKRRTLIHILKKLVCFENTGDGTISPSFNIKIMGRLI